MHFCIFKVSQMYFPAVWRILGHFWSKIGLFGGVLAPPGQKLHVVGASGGILENPLIFKKALFEADGRYF